MEAILIVLTGGNSVGNIYNVYINNKPFSYVYKLIALWNGGPGIVWYFPRDINDKVLIDINNSNRLATAFRLGFIRVKNL